MHVLAITYLQGYHQVVARKTENGDRVTTAVRLPRDLHERLHDEAEARELAVNFLVVRAIEHYLDRLIPADELQLIREGAA